jgi:hypothetical protein
MKNRFTPFLLLLSLFAATGTRAQTYCTPAMTTGGMYIMDIYYSTLATGITGGADQINGSNGYINNSGSSAGTIQRNCTVSLYYHLNNPTAGVLAYNFRVFADWNNDGDFDDAGEIAADIDGNLNGATTLGTGLSFAPDPRVGSTVRIRWALRQGGSKATSCGGYTGEIEDYKLSLPANTAPVLNNAGTPFLNALKQTQTSSGGESIESIVNSTNPGTIMITDADACTTIKGIAVTSTTAANGTWQYRAGSAGTWTNMGAVSTSNALLLYSSGSNDTRIRFVPTGPGTASFDYKAWDRSAGTNGSYYNITATGGATAFSTANETASLTTYSTAAVSGDQNVYMPVASSNAGTFNILAASLTASSGIMKEAQTLTTGNVQGFGTDIDYDAVNGKLVWTGGPTSADLMRCNTDGSNVQTLSTGFLNYGTGVAVGGNKIFIADYGVLYSCNADGSSMTAITGGAGQASNIGTLSDIEYYNSKIYYVNQPGYTGSFKIEQANADGTGTTELYSTTNTIYGLSVAGGTMYWTELDGSNNGYVKSKPVSGGSATSLVTQAGRIFLDVFADVTNAKIYIADADALSYSDGNIKSIPLGGGSVTSVQSLELVSPSLVFIVSSSSLPAQFMGISARQQGSANLVEWQVGTEDNVDHYSIERSPNGSSFTEAGTTSATSHRSYSWTDSNPYDNTSFYRVKAIDRDGKTRYSNIVQLSSGKSSAGISVYPNAVTGKQFMLQLNNLPSGNYSLQLYNAAGQPVFNKTIQHPGGYATQAILLPQTLAAGMYRIRLSGKEQFSLGIIVE